MKYITILLLLLLPLNLVAQQIEGDSIARRSFFESKGYNTLHVGVPLIAAGLVIQPAAKKFRQNRNSYIPSAQTSVDNYTQYAPAALMVGLKAAGVESRSSWGRMLTSDAFSVGIATLAVNGLKRSTKVARPDTGADNSFPSGHTTTAFMTATMLHKEYGAKSYWYSVAGYTAATATGLMRMVNNRHWVSDVLVGAGLGILSTEAGYLIADAVFKKRGINEEYDTYNTPDWREIERPSSVGLYLGFVKPVGSISPSDADEPITIETGSKIGVEGNYFFNKYIGVGGRIALSNCAINVGREVQNEDLDIISAGVGCYVAYPFASRWRVGSKAIAGLSHYKDCNPSKEVDIRKGGRAEIGTSLSLEYLSNRHFSMKLLCDYDASFQPYLPTSKIYHSILLGFGGNIIF